MARNASRSSTELLVDVKRGLVSRELFVDEDVYQQEAAARR